MADLIERQAAISIFERYKVWMLSAIKGYDFVKELESIPSAQPEPQWIPCSERLPEATREFSDIDTDGTPFSWKESDWVLAQRSTGEMVVAEYTIGDRGGYWETMDNHGFNVLAWMPLPEPWRGEEHE